MSTSSEKNDAPGTPQNCPWATHPATGEHERLSPPAPMIELDTPVSSKAVKPLGPRRLARLQREMAEHAREIQDAERANRGTGVDDALLAKQQRLADLAVRAAAANERDRHDAQRALARSGDAAAPEASGAAAAGVMVPGTATPRAGVPRTTTAGIPAPGTHDPRAQAPDATATSWPASPVDYGPGPATTQIPIYIAPAEATAAPAAAEPAAGPEAGPGERAGGDAAASSTEDSHHAPPGRPVRAVDAEGLELLEPGAYRSRGGWMRWLLVLLLLVVAALAVVLIMFIL